MKDPVCGMSVDQDKAVGTTEYQGETYYFCSEKCLHKFEQAPTDFLNGDKKRQKILG